MGHWAKRGTHHGRLNLNVTSFPAGSFPVPVSAGSRVACGPLSSGTVPLSLLVLESASLSQLSSGGSPGDAFSRPSHTFLANTHPGTLPCPAWHSLRRVCGRKGTPRSPRAAPVASAQGRVRWFPSVKSPSLHCVRAQGTRQPAAWRRVFTRTAKQRNRCIEREKQTDKLPGCCGAVD